MAKTWISIPFRMKPKMPSKTRSAWCWWLLFMFRTEFDSRTTHNPWRCTTHYDCLLFHLNDDFNKFRDQHCPNINKTIEKLFILNDSHFQANSRFRFKFKLLMVRVKFIRSYIRHVNIFHENNLSSIHLPR